MSTLSRSSWRWPLLGVAVVLLAVVAWGLGRVSASAGTPARTPDPTTLGYDIGVAGKPAPTGQVREFQLTVKEAEWEIAPGVRVPAITFNGQVPGPTIRVTEGDTLRVIVKNELRQATAIHWHGLHVPNAMDGVPPLTQPEIAPGATFTYEFPASHAGTFMYHSHQNAVEQIDRGLYAPLIIDPATPPPAKFDKEFTMLLSAWNTTTMPASDHMMPGGMDMGGAGQAGGMTGMSMNYNYFTINGKAFPANDVWTVKEGDLVRVRIMNVSNLAHPMHLHGHDFTVIAKDGEPIRPEVQQTMNTLSVDAGETYDIVFTADNSGVWVFHCHELHHTENDGVEPGGLMQIIQYEGVQLPKLDAGAPPVAGTDTDHAALPTATALAHAAPEALPAGAVWVANEHGDSLSVIDTGTNQVVATLKGIPGPHNVQVAPDGKSVWAVSGHENLAVAIDATTYQMRGTVSTGKEPSHIVLTPDGKRAYVTNSGDNTVTVIDVAAMKVVATIPVGSYPHGLRPSPEGRWVAVANMKGATISLIDTATNQQVADIPVGQTPVQVGFDPSGEFLYVSLNAENAVAKVDVAARKLVGKAGVGGGPVQVFVAPDGQTLLVANQGTADQPSTTVSVLDTASFTVLTTVETGQGAHGVVIDPSGTHAYITNLYGNDVAVLALSTRKVVGRIAVGDTPNGVSFAPQAPAPPPAPEISITLPHGEENPMPGMQDTHP